MRTIDDAVAAGVKEQGVNVGEKGIEKIRAKSGRLILVKVVAGDEIIFGLVEEFDVTTPVCRCRPWPAPSR